VVNIKVDFQEIGLGHGLDLSGSGWGPVSATCKWGNESSDSIKCAEFLA